jgi:mycofactocin system transcriptional regulator
MGQDNPVTTSPAIADRAGRPPVTTAAELERVALGLFTRRGFAATTVEDIAAAAGISRRTFFRYYASKKDVVWGDFDQGLRHMADVLRGTGDGVPLQDAVRSAVISFNALSPAAVPAHRQRMALILHVPELQAHSTLRYAAWRAVVAEFAAGRLGRSVDDLVPQLFGHVALAAALAAYAEWLRKEDADLGQLLDASFRAVEVTSD